MCISITLLDVFIVLAIVWTPASSAPAEKRGAADDDVIRDRKPRDLWRQVRRRPLDEERFVERRSRYYEPDLYYDEKRSIRPMNPVN